jgi:hypothetical protein
MSYKPTSQPLYREIFRARVKSAVAMANAVQRYEANWPRAGRALCLRRECPAVGQRGSRRRTTDTHLWGPALTVRSGEWREGEMVCSKDSFGTTGCRGPGAGRVLTIDGWR